MAIDVSGLPVIGFSLTLPNAATVVPIDDVLYGSSASPPPGNCCAIVFYNTDSTNAVYLKFARTGTAGAMGILDSTIIPAGGSFTADLPSEGGREPIGSTEAVCAYLRAAAGNNVVVNVSYVMNRGGGV